MLLDHLRSEKASQLRGGLYHKMQIELAYNSNQIEGSQLTEDQTRYIYETNTIGVDKNEVINVDDIIETTNHFGAVDYLLETADQELTEEWIKKIHSLLKQGTSDARKSWFQVGDYKQVPNEVGGRITSLPEMVPKDIATLLKAYHQKTKVDLEVVLDFHVRFERIHPFQDGNVRVGRLIMLKECLKHGITPFIITDDLKYFYYRGLNEWVEVNGYLMDNCLTAQDWFEEYLKYFRVEEK
ncbi:Fic family protein [Streptococcus ovuberis]|uniref:Fic family protein n=1 Tax=Streptococcus ovuberis TaxID=1936207 RepID=A0A7X6MZD3_9STRE|nr:Fic family protein [Streptococcus ovuberis]NKZ19387.1 Fic family protein [Streptococcus ovuberis]